MTTTAEREPTAIAEAANEIAGHGQGVKSKHAGNMVYDLLAALPVPVAEVMNGGGFGYTGFDYYNDQITEGRFGARKRPREYVIAPSYIVPPRY